MLFSFRNAPKTSLKTFEARKRKKQFTIENCLLCFFRVLRRWPPQKSDPAQPENKQKQGLKTVSCVLFSFPSWAEGLSCLTAKMLQWRHSKPRKRKKQTTAAKCLLCFVRFHRETEDFFMSCLASKMLQKQYSEPRKRTKQTPTQSCPVCVCEVYFFIHFRCGLRASRHV